MHLDVATDYLKMAVEKHPKSSILATRLALLLLISGDRSAYLDNLKSMLEKFKDSSPTDLNNLAWTCAYVTNDMSDAKKAVEFARQSVDGNSTTKSQNPTYLNTYGANLFRAGEVEEAICRLDDATCLRKTTTYEGALDKLFISMSHAAAGRPDQARQALTDAGAIIDELNSKANPEKLLSPEIRVSEWLDQNWEQIECGMIRKEAQQFLQSRVPNPTLAP